MKVLKQFWRLFREATGEADYERYCAHLRVHHPGRSLPTQREFYLLRLSEKYSRVSRCC